MKQLLSNLSGILKHGGGSQHRSSHRRGAPIDYHIIMSL